MEITNEMRDLWDLIEKYLKNEVDPLVAEYDARGEYPEKIYNELIDMGLNLLAVPTEYDGLMVDHKTETYIAEILGRHDCGIGSAIGVTNSACTTMNYFGTEDQKKDFFGILTSGKLAGFCLTEPNAGSDSASVKTTAVLDGDEYVLNGTKCFITNGGIAGVYIVFASTDLSKGTKGLSAFYVESDRKGLTIGKHEDKMGIRLSNTTQVIFEDCRIPKDHLLGEEGKGFIYAMKTLGISRNFVGGLAVGLAQRAIDECKEYVKNRVQFGKPIAYKQGIQFMLADMQTQTAAARTLAYHAADLIDKNGEYRYFSNSFKDDDMKVVLSCILPIMYICAIFFKSVANNI
jgi:alkylation response protein AidB-like acyl-CoA dehydrogenase